MNTTHTPEEQTQHTPPYDFAPSHFVCDGYPTDESPVGHLPVPGRQIGLYCDADARDVRQMVRMINNPEDDGQDSRG